MGSTWCAGTVALYQSVRAIEMSSDQCRRESAHSEEEAEEESQRAGICGAIRRARGSEGAHPQVGGAANASALAGNACLDACNWRSAYGNAAATALCAGRRLQLLLCMANL